MARDTKDGLHARKTVRVNVLEHWGSPPLRRTGVIVNRYFALIRCDSQWNLVHRPSGLRTRFFSQYSRSLILALGRAATAHFTSEILQISDPQQFSVALRKANAETWSHDWFQAHRQQSGADTRASKARQ